jgi:hypothetical protein
LASTGNGLIDEGAKQAPLASVQLSNYPPQFHHDFIHPRSLLIVKPTDLHEYTGDEEDFSNNLYHINNADPFPVQLSFYGSNNNPILI